MGVGTVTKSWLGNKPQSKKLGADGTIILKCGRKKQMIEWVNWLRAGSKGSLVKLVRVS